MSEWISVNERLPERDEIVLVCDVRDDSDLYIGIWALQCDVEGENCWTDETGLWRHFGEVTHWMPLPEPPAAVAENATATRTEGEKQNEEN